MVQQEATDPALAESTSALSADNGMQDAEGTNARPMSLDAPAQQHERKHVLGKRSAGLWLYDFLLYPILSNTTVFLTSVVATYLSMEGGRKIGGKPVFGKVGTWFHKRSNETDKFFESTFHMQPQTAKNSRIVLWSFVDGSLLSIPVKWMENYRERFAQGVDNALGAPAPASAYEAEPKQTWLSVIGGRIATAAIVVSTALVFETKGLNKKLFQGGADKLEGFIRSKPRWNAFFERPKVKDRINLNSLAYVGVFEAVYTTICTAGLWIGSRVIATFQNNQQDNAEKLRSNSVKETRIPSFGKEADISFNITNNTQAASPDALIKFAKHEDRLNPAYVMHNVER